MKNCSAMKKVRGYACQSCVRVDAPRMALAQDKKLDSFYDFSCVGLGNTGAVMDRQRSRTIRKYGLDGNLIYIASGVTSV